MPSLEAVRVYLKQIGDAIGLKDLSMEDITAVLERKRQYRIPNSDTQTLKTYPMKKPLRGC